MELKRLPTKGQASVFAGERQNDWEVISIGEQSPRQAACPSLLGGRGLGQSMCPTRPLMRQEGR